MMHPFTFIHPSANIGMNVQVDPFATIHPDVEIGEGTWIGSNAVIMSGTRIGKYCKVFPGAVIGAASQDLKYKEGDYSQVIIGDKTTIREFVTINRATGLNGKTIIKDNVLLMAYTHIGHDCIIGNNCVVSNNGQIAGHVKLDDYVVVGGVVAIQQFVHIGKHAFVGACTHLHKDIPPFIRAAKTPLSYVGINSVGLRRRGFTSEQINEIADIYRYIYNSGMIFSQAIAKINLDFQATQNRDDITSFIENSSLGIVKCIELEKE